jgi:hypothetical protein
MESQQWFHRSSLSGQLVLQREDYALVMAQPFGTVFYLDIYMYNGSSWRVYWQGKFTLTDCTVNVDDQKLSVKVQVVDDYNEILAGWEKEYDLIKLLPEMQKIKITKRPMMKMTMAATTRPPMVRLQLKRRVRKVDILSRPWPVVTSVTMVCAMLRMLSMGLPKLSGRGNAVKK